MASTLFIGNLPFIVDENKLKQTFSTAGTVVSVKIVTDKYSGKSRGFGFIEMSSIEEAKKAIELFNGTAVEGRPLVVNIAHDPKPLS